MSAGMHNEQPRDIVQRFYAGAARGEITSFRDWLSEDFVLFVPPQLPWGGTFDKAQYVALLPRVAAVLDFTRMAYVSLTSEGRHVVALIKIAVRGTNDIIMISEHWDIRDGKAIRLLVAYFDPTPLLNQIQAAVAA
jgi:ketosteroid isomerase-like protein